MSLNKGPYCTWTRVIGWVGLDSLDRAHFNADDHSNMDLKGFQSVFQDILAAFENDFDADCHQAIVRWKQILEYNVASCGKKNHGILTVTSFIKISGSQSEEEIYLARILGWIVEMLIAAIIIEDDILDNAETRRGKVCWYKVDGIGLTAINDSLLLKNSVFVLLNKYFRHKPFYTNILELINKHLLYIYMGQSMDMETTQTNNKLDLDKFTEENLITSMKYKAALFQYVPVVLAMYLAEITDEKLHRKVKDVILEIGMLSEIQNDYHDCFGDFSVTGKVGNDIEEGKCTWLIVKALDFATPDQKKILQDNYGCKDSMQLSRVQSVKNLYDQLKLHDCFAEYEKMTYKRIKKKIQLLENEFPIEILHEILGENCKQMKVW